MHQIDDRSSVSLQDTAIASPIEQTSAPAPANKHILFGNSPQMRERQNRLSQIGWSEVPVLIQGETGTGKVPSVPS
jgi:transcriptional regulator with PAS, ATPase and Fis domain